MNRRVSKESRNRSRTRHQTGARRFAGRFVESNFNLRDIPCSKEASFGKADDNRGKRSWCRAGRFDSPWEINAPARSANERYICLLRFVSHAPSRERVDADNEALLIRQLITRPFPAAGARRLEKLVITRSSRRFHVNGVSGRMTRRDCDSTRLDYSDRSS